MNNPDDTGARATHLLAGLPHLVLDGFGTSLLALAGGLIAARAMRRLGLQWSWAAGAAAIVLLARPLAGSATVAPALCAVAASWSARSAHRRELLAGGDLARAARSRRTPMAWLRRNVQRAGVPARSLAGRRLLTPRCASTERLRLGVQADGRQVSVACRGGSPGHTLVLGATGSGKTVTQTLLAVRAIEAGRAVVVVDPKGDRDMARQLREAALACSRRFCEWSPEGPCVYNPYGRGGETEIADRALAGERFTEPHYLRQAQRYTGHIVRALRASGRTASLASIVELLDPQAFELLLRTLPEPQAAAGHEYLDSLPARTLRDLAGVRDRLAILTESDVGEWLDPATDGVQLDLLAAVRSRAVVYFKLESDSRPLLSRMLAAAIVADLQSLVATLQGRPAPALLVIDEFSAVAAEQVVALFGRARSAGFSLLLGTQELSDLRLPGGEYLLEQILGNLSLLIAHRQVVPESAELLARLGGSRGCWRTTWSSSGRATRTRSQESVLDPHSLTTLTPGWGAVIALGDPAGARVARIEASVGVGR